MDNSKAKKAVKKSTKHKKQSKKPADESLLLAQQLKTGAIDPEIQAASIDMQPADGYVNPRRALGAMAPMLYTPGNLLPGYTYPVMVNPEA